MRKYLIFSLPLAAIFLCCTARTSRPAPTLILYNGHIFTADSLQTQVSAVAVLDDRIVATGTDAAIRALAGDHTKLVDLQGAFAMPGFIEGHGHFASLGHSLESLNLLHTASWEDITQQVAVKVKTTQPGAWIDGRGWHQEKWTVAPAQTVNGYPYHDLLSAVSPDNPVVLSHASGHALIANAKAMELAGISRETPDPVGGRIVRDASGKLTGVFEENAMDLIEQPFSAWKQRRSEAARQADFDQTIALATRACQERGITSFQDAGSEFWELDQYSRLAQQGRLGVRIWAMILQPHANNFPKLSNYPQIGVGNGFFTCRAVKAYLDGALGSYGAWLLEPYADKPDSYGQNTTPIDSIAALAVQCRNHKLQLCVHAIGDRANREVLNIFEKTAPAGGLRWRIEHAQHLNPLDIPRFHQLGVIASMQAIHCTSDAPFVVKRLGETRARAGAYAWRALLDSGAHLANGTDTPVEEPDPLPCLYAAVTRKRADTGLELFPEQRMTREEALLAYTRWNAWAAFEDTEKGSLQAGKLADIVVLDQDLLHCAPELILKAKVVRTIIGGKTVYPQNLFEK
jgi:hypothetical protein